VGKIFPASCTAGLTFKHRADPACYSAADGWTLSALLRGPSVIDIVATVDAGKHLFAAAASATASWAPGRYDYAIRAAKAGEVHELETGVMQIEPDLSSRPAGFDGRTHAERTLAAIEAVLEQRASLDQEEYKINNRELRRTPIAELLKLRDTYRAEVQSEQMRARGGAEFGRAVKVIL
jgi:hypothetical protein